MPKEQIRKRGRRKPKEEEEAPLSSAQPVPAQAAPVHQEPSAVAGPSTAGLHPSRAALISGKRPAPPPPRQENGTPEEANNGGEEGGEPLQWARGPRVDPGFPFGELNPDLKAYFKTVEEQISEWQTTSSTGEEREGQLERLL
jgi:nucleolar protein 9